MIANYVNVANQGFYFLRKTLLAKINFSVKSFCRCRFFLHEVKFILALVCNSKLRSWVFLYKQEFSTIKTIFKVAVSYGNEVSLLQLSL